MCPFTSVEFETHTIDGELFAARVYSYRAGDNWTWEIVADNADCICVGSKHLKKELRISQLINFILDKSS